MRLNQRYNPFPIKKPYDGIYAHGVEIPSESRQLTVSGQVGVSPQGTTPKDFKGQATQAIENLKNVLNSAGMELEDLVHMRFYLVDRQHIPELSSIRSEYLDGIAPAVTTFIVSGLVEEDWLIEIEGLAAKVQTQMVDDRFAKFI
jgi:enamine deaminase RidA (YjgF/YER057c/UK114 family)